MFELSTADLIRLAAERDQPAWNELVRRFAALVWSVARESGLPSADAADVCQATWLILAQNLAGLREPSRLASWLATTARREAVRVSAFRHRETPLESVDIRIADDPETSVLAEDTDRELWQALAGLPEQCRRLLRLMAHAPELSYAQTARALGIGVGSIGQTRGRCLTVLRRRLTADGVAR
ncbi:MAG TPA: sigma-70 family RNA polymerase sigma factor [Pseudonocardiaceae bacterium]|nr:sigma-70 family RNA polymerase sigma factor [Pseudonocardiaceae bacterium]